jgi:cytochrome d ubiquinol oxidase subunit I
VSKSVHWFSALMVAVGATISAFWILVANSWQQTPAGFVLRNGRAELTSFWGAVFNPSTMIRFFHTVDAAVITGAFFMAGIASYLIIRNKGADVAKRALILAVIVGFVASVLELFPFGHEHAKQVAHTQPEKFAAIEGLYTTQSDAPLALFGYPIDKPPDLKAPIEISGLLSWLAFGDVGAEVKGIDAFPEDERPPLWLTFVSFHNMVILGMLFIAMTGLGVLLLIRKTLFESRWLLRAFIWAIPLPIAACELGWVAAEVGRQPWIVYRMLRTSDAASVTVSGGEIVFSMMMFGLIYLLLGAVYVFLLIRKVKHGPEPVVGEVAI